MSKELPMHGNVVYNERGNNLLVRGNQFVSWLRTGDETWLEVAWSPDNYPALCVTHMASTDDSLLEHIDRLVADDGWEIRKLNLTRKES